MRHHYVWGIINTVLFILSLAIIWFIRQHDSTAVLYGQLFAQIGFVLFLVNVNMYFVLLIIRKSPDRNVKKQFALLSRKLMKAHIPIAIGGTFVILIHAVLMWRNEAAILGYLHPKLLSGMVAIILLACTLFAGYLRRKRASGFRRKFHLSMALVFGGLIIIHLIMPIH